MTVKLGDLVRDKITGYTGIAVARTEWLHGCVRVTVQSQELKDGKPVETSTFDEPQLAIVGPSSYVDTGAGDTHGERPDPPRGR